MADVDFFSAFEYAWGDAGTVDTWADTQYKLGWASIGSVPPSVEQFNAVHQIADKKANWLFNLLKEVTDNAGLTLSAGSSDTLLLALQKSVVLTLPTAPSSKLSDVIYVLDRDQHLRWQTIGTFTGYASAEVGKFDWGTTDTPRPFEELAIGQTIDGTLPKYQALIAWVIATGKLKASADWVAKEYFWADLGSGSYRMPDMRNQFIRATGTDADTAIARALGSSQSDSFKSHTHGIPKNVRNVAAGSSDSITEVVGVQQASGATGGVETRGTNTALMPVVIL